jgi:hypothetical protein
MEYYPFSSECFGTYAISRRIDKMIIFCYIYTSKMDNMCLHRIQEP